jgi:hypothetical protein
MNQDHIYSACIVLLLDLYADHGAESTRTTGLDRMMVRQKIHRAIGWLDKTQPRTAKAARLLERLLDEEDRHVRQHGEDSAMGYSRLLEITAESNQEEQAIERGNRPMPAGMPEGPMPLDAMLEPKPARSASLTESHSSADAEGSIASMDLPPVPHDTALYPALVWPYDAPPAGIPSNHSSSGFAPTPASNNAIEADALLALASGDSAGQHSHSASIPPTFSGQSGPKPDGDVEMNLANIMSGTQQFNDDVLWQMVFGSTTQVGIEGLTGVVVSAAS